MNGPSKQIKELESLIQAGEHMLSGNQDETAQSGDGSDEEYESGSEGVSESDSYDTLDEIGFTTSCLIELGPSLAMNLKHAEDALDSHANLKDVPFSISGPAMVYVRLIRDKFKQAHNKLVERLGEANWQRHTTIRERLENPELFLEEKSGIASSVFRPYSDFHDSGIGTSVPAQTEYAQSHTSFQSSNTEGEQLSLRVPKEPPEVSEGKAFECFLCRRIISNIKNRVDWK